jgi:hypothetical protein
MRMDQSDSGDRVTFRTRSERFSPGHQGLRAADGVVGERRLREWDEIPGAVEAVP